MPACDRNLRVLAISPLGPPVLSLGSRQGASLPQAVGTTKSVFFDSLSDIARHWRVMSMDMHGCFGKSGLRH